MASEDDPIITINDVRLAGHCTAGARTWFDTHGFTREQFRQFLKPVDQGGGFPASMFLAIDDNGFAAQVIERKRAREHG